MDKSYYESVFEAYVAEYSKIFNFVYPAKAANSFLEANLTTNFIKAIGIVEGHLHAALTYDEFPIPSECKPKSMSKKESNHIDSVIFDFDENNPSIYMVEAKRVSHSKQDCSPIVNDMLRMVNVANHKTALPSKMWAQKTDHGKRIDAAHFNRFKTYGIALCSFWVNQNNASKEVAKKIIGKALSKAAEGLIQIEEDNLLVSDRVMLKNANVEKRWSMFLMAYCWEIQKEPLSIPDNNPYESLERGHGHEVLHDLTGFIPQGENDNMRERLERILGNCECRLIYSRNGGKYVYFLPEKLAERYAPRDNGEYTHGSFTFWIDFKNNSLAFKGGEIREPKCPQNPAISAVNVPDDWTQKDGITYLAHHYIFNEEIPSDNATDDDIEQWINRALESAKKFTFIER